MSHTGSSMQYYQRCFQSRAQNFSCEIESVVWTGELLEEDPWNIFLNTSRNTKRKNQHRRFELGSKSKRVLKEVENI